MYRKLLNHALIVSLVWATTPAAFAGDVIVDNFTAGDLTDDTSLTLTDVGSGTADTFNIVETLGQRADTNLFHSFLSFNIDPAEVALFSGDPAITNVISRVSGGGQSLIDGTIRNDIAGANFWFVNTAGVMIGANAVFDVSGALSIGAVDYVLLEGGARFYALEEPGENISALSFNPVDFGFLPATAAGDLTITGLTLDDTATGSLIGDITLAGGNVSITDSTITNKPEASGSAITISGPSVTLNNTTIQNQANGFDADDITITATAGDVFIHNGAIVRSNPSSTPTDVGATGSIMITASDDVRVNVDDAGVATGEPNVVVSSSPAGASSGAGDIAVQGTNVLASGLQISSNNNSNAVASGQGTVTVHAAGVDAVGGFIGGELNLASSTINADAGGGPASDIFLTTGQDTGGIVQGSVTLTSTTVLAASGSSNPAGTFGVTADTFEMTGGAAVAEAFADGDAGVIDIDAARSLTLNNTFLYTPALSTAAVGSGSITLSSTGVDVDNQGVVNINNTRIGTETRGASAAGNVVVNGGAINVTGTSGGLGIEANSVTAATGAAGSISFVGDSLTLTDAKINTSTVSNTVTPGAGDINADISGAIDATNSLVESSTSGNADAGNITLNSASFSMSGGEIAARNTGAGTGAAGDITLNDNTSAVLDTVTITGGGDLRADAGSDGTTAGNIQINAIGLVSVSGDGGPVTDPGDPTIVDPVLVDAAVAEITSSAGEGSAGAVTIAGSSVNLTNTVVSTESASTTVNAPAAINITALEADTGSVTLLNTGVVASTSGIADASDITVSGPTIRVTGLGAEFDPSGDPVLDASNNVVLSQGIEATSSDAGATGGGAGSVLLTGNALTMFDGRLESSTASGDGTKAPGTITIDINTAPTATPGSGDVAISNTDIEASASGSSSAGDITISGANTSIDIASAVTATSTGTGAAGSINVSGLNEVTIGSSVTLESNADNPNASASGNISITAGQVDAGGTVATIGNITLNNTIVNLLTSSDVSTPGTITIGATGDVSISGGVFLAESMGLGESGSIFVGGLNGGAAGNITIDTLSLTTDSRAGGDAGSVSFVSAGDFNSTNSSFRSRGVNFTCLSTPPCPGGAGGSVLFEAANIDITNALINSISVEEDAGSIQFRAPGSIEVSGGSMSADAFGNGDAGDILFGGPLPGTSAASVTINDFAFVSSTARAFPDFTSLTGNAGTITVDADTIVLNQATLRSVQGGINVDSGAAGVLQFTGNSLTIDNSNLSTTNSSGNAVTPANSGLITVTGTATGAPGTGEISITNSVVAASTSGAMTAGDIVLAADNIVLDGVSVQSATTASGSAGNITLQGTGAGGDGLQTVVLSNGTDLLANASEGTAGASAGEILID
ncbi:MAG: filamentous hemagglutinin N-terminal domain-containing protein, partial [Gammaproteobacteria bacterium]|nr:filamentous hemagglutinin N-terminal domain-containing protein [Gammaproteobacteria bacterium]